MLHLETSEPAVEAGSGGTLLVANPSADLYGSDRMMLEAVRGLVASGWRVVVTCSDDGPLVPRLVDAGAEVVIMAVPVVRKSMLSPRGLVGLAGEALRSLPRMGKLIEQIGPDAIMINTVTIPLWLVAARWARVPAAVHVHEAESSVSRIARLGLTAPLVLANRVIYNSETSRRVSRVELLERRQRTTVIHNGVQGPKSVTLPRTELDGPLRLVYVGRLSPRKGVDVAVRAVAGLREGGVPATLAVVGSVFPGYEWYEAELRALVHELGLDASVTFHGFQNEVWPFLAAADVALVPSRLEESFGNTVIETLSAARPVLVSDHSGLREAAEGFEAAALLPADDPAVVVEQLLRICAEWPHWRDRAVRDARRAQRLYGPLRYHRALADDLGELTRSGRRRLVEDGSTGT